MIIPAICSDCDDIIYFNQKNSAKNTFINVFVNEAFITGAQTSTIVAGYNAINEIAEYTNVIRQAAKKNNLNKNNLRLTIHTRNITVQNNVTGFIIKNIVLSWKTEKIIREKKESMLLVAARINSTVSPAAQRAPTIKIAKSHPYPSDLRFAMILFFINITSYNLII
jgi:hypothetical protein